MSLQSNWVSSPYHFVRLTQIPDTLTTRQLTYSGSKFGLGLLKTLKVLVQHNRAGRANPILHAQVQDARQKLDTQRDIRDTLESISHGAQLCLPSHKLACLLKSPELRCFFSTLAHVCAPAASEGDDSDSSQDNNSDSSEGEEDDHSSERDEDEAMIDCEMEELSVDDDDDDDDDDDQDGDDSMRDSSQEHGDSQHSEYDPPSLPELDEDEGGESKKLEIEVQVMGYELAKAVLTSIRMNEPVDDMAPALEYSISRDKDVLELKVPPIKSTVEDDGGADLRRYNTRGQWVDEGKVPRSLIFEFKSTPRNVAPQHLAEVLKVLQQRFKWLGVKSVADLQMLDERFLKVCLLSGQGKYFGVMFAHIPKVWCRRHFFDDQTLPPMIMTDKEQYIRLVYEAPFNLSTPSGRPGAAALLIAAIVYSKALVDFGLETIAASRAVAPAPAV